ncbi:hypothetical protein PP724_22925 [Ralstonia solanacearum]|uniref:hypothetical protein n=1 Tax=Ralstonia solanacearum TaxID=305 RepID=UPI001FFB638F|nr:hypothetical protein [Ralstonia solanacearum]MDC6237021.1 hypothetical protein [Ralstonia solanacearum]MDD7810576.1 hypothetical protein [Ralstonia solanacearum]
MALAKLKPTELCNAVSRLVETLQKNPAGAAALVVLAFIGLVAWVVYVLGK